MREEKVSINKVSRGMEGDLGRVGVTWSVTLEENEWRPTYS
jgi:hypothetical protein